MTKIVDATGLSCPAPVLMVRDAIVAENPDALEVRVDNEAAEENVSRFLGTQYSFVTVSQDKGGRKIHAHGRKEGLMDIPKTEPATQAAVDAKQKIMVFISSDRIGSGDDELGKKLMISFIKTLKEMGDELWRLAFVNSGVRLAVSGSPVIEDLMAHETEGVHILVCGTCLDHFDLLADKKVGETTNMLDIVTAMQLADKVVSI